MTRENLVTVTAGVSPDEARRLLHRHRIEKLLVVDDAYRCVGLITVKDMDKAETHPLANKDELGRLRVAAATGVGPDGHARSRALIEAEVDVIVVDTAHGHSRGVLEAVTAIKKLSNAVQVIAGNVATPEGALALIEAGADGGEDRHRPGLASAPRAWSPASACRSSPRCWKRAAACREHGVPAIADGGMRTSGDIVKAIAAGADAVMIGSLLAGTDEAPGEVFLYQGRSYKSYRGMGSIGAMARGSADRYFQQDIKDQLKLVPEGVEGMVPYKGPVRAGDPPAGRRAARRHGLHRQRATSPNCSATRGSAASPAPACARATCTTWRSAARRRTTGRTEAKRSGPCQSAPRCSTPMARCSMSTPPWRAMPRASARLAAHQRRVAGQADRIHLGAQPGRPGASPRFLAR